jgi:SRSO17 transposase
VSSAPSRNRQPGSSTIRGFPKKGEHSVGVARRYSGTLGKTANCQIAVRLHRRDTRGSSPLGFRLYLII